MRTTILDGFALEYSALLRMCSIAFPFPSAFRALVGHCFRTTRFISTIDNLTTPKYLHLVFVEHCHATYSFTGDSMTLSRSFI